MSAPKTGKKQPTAIVVGAGVGGVASAARLAHAGFAVTVLEQNDFTGGRCSLIHTESGHRFDQGPSLLLLPRLFHETYADLGTSMEAEGVKLVRCDPNYHVHFGDGECFTMSPDLVTMKNEIERFEGEEGFRG
jgi:phytoene desaturase (3,4-didehydrolycopene-forming)